MVQDWEQGFVGNKPGTIAGLAKSETLAQVMVRAFRPIPARSSRERQRLPRAA
ncbi:MAG: hypothetical protein ACEQR8_08270 [Cypionkella sp.]